MVTRNYQITDADSERRLAALCESVLYPRMHPFTQHALRVESRSVCRSVCLFARAYDYEC